jgi:hypothetical protein
MQVVDIELKEVETYNVYELKVFVFRHKFNMSVITMKRKFLKNDGAAKTGNCLRK